MINNLLITAATEKELSCIKPEAIHKSIPAQTAPLIETLITGIGSVSSVYSLMYHLMHGKRPDLLINIGIAGSFSREINIGSVLVAGSDRFADLGIYSAGNFIPIEKSGIISKNDKISPSGSYKADHNTVSMLSALFPVVNAITVNTSTGTDAEQQRLSTVFKPDIETMEGAGFYYVCNKTGIPCVGIRAVSNYTGPREKGEWDLDRALENLSSAVTDAIKLINE